MNKKIRKAESLTAVHTYTHTGNLREKGITLIALVVTIVVLLILAGISINLVLGDNGIINKAKIASNKSDAAQVKEQIIIAASSWYMDKKVANEDETKALEKFKKSIPESFNVEKNEDGTLFVHGLINGKEYKYFVLEDGNVVTDALLDRVKQGDYINYNSPSLSGGENWRVLYVDNDKIYLISTGPTEIIQASNNGVEESEESVKEFVTLMNKVRQEPVNVKVGRDKDKFPDDTIESKDINYLSNMANNYQLTVTLEQMKKALNMSLISGNRYNYDEIHSNDSNNIFNISDDCFYIGNYFGNLGDGTTNKNCIYMWWSKIGGIGPCWALQSSFTVGTKIRPVVELKEEIKVTSGNGSIEYPYQIEI